MKNSDKKTTWGSARDSLSSVSRALWAQKQASSSQLSLTTFLVSKFLPEKKGKFLFK